MSKNEKASKVSLKRCRKCGIIHLGGKLYRHTCRKEKTEDV